MRKSEASQTQINDNQDTDDYQTLIGHQRQDVNRCNCRSITFARLSFWSSEVVALVGTIVLLCGLLYMLGTICYRQFRIMRGENFQVSRKRDYFYTEVSVFGWVVMVLGFSFKKFTRHCCFPTDEEIKEFEKGPTEVLCSVLSCSCC